MKNLFNKCVDFYLKYCIDAGAIEHFLYAIVISTIFVLLGHFFIGGLTYVGCGVSAGIFIGRFVTKNEYIWIEKFGKGLRANMPRFAGWYSVTWTLHSILGVVYPFVGIGLVVIGYKLCT